MIRTAVEISYRCIKQTKRSTLKVQQCVRRQVLVPSRTMEFGNTKTKECSKIATAKVKNLTLAILKRSKWAIKGLKLRSKPKIIHWYSNRILMWVQIRLALMKELLIHCCCKLICSRDRNHVPIISELRTRSKETSQLRPSTSWQPQQS